MTFTISFEISIFQIKTYTVRTFKNLQFQIESNRNSSLNGLDEGRSKRVSVEIAVFFA